MKCPSCGSDAESGRFCANCGAALGKAECSECGHKPPAGARFCNQCGAAMGASTTSAQASGNQVAWWMAGGLLLGLVLVIAYPLYSGRDAAPAPFATGPVTGPAARPVAGRPSGSPPDLSAMTPREAADRLFERVMRAASAGNSAEVVQFLPMAIPAYELAEPLDTDGRVHLVLLRLTGQFNAEALEDAEEILSEQPNHLLGLALAGDASLALSDSAGARAYYGRWLDAYETEVAKGLSEYEEHAGMFPDMRAKAEALVRND